MTETDRITDESNSWLNAIKMEDKGKFFEAFFLHLTNTEESLKQNLLIKAALSSSCAANCLSVTGNLASARQLYLQTAMLYEINGDTILDKSIREALWSYQESYEYYQLSCDSEKAQTVCEKYISIARRVNPFEGEEEAMKSLRLRKKNAEAIQKEYVTLFNLYEDKKQKKEAIGNNTPTLFSDIDKTLERLEEKEELKEKSVIPEIKNPTPVEKPRKILNQINVIGKTSAFVVLENENNIDPTKLDLYDDEMLTSFYEKLYHKSDDNSRKRLLAIHAELRRRYDRKVNINNE